MCWVKYIIYFQNTLGHSDSNAGVISFFHIVVVNQCLGNARFKCWGNLTNPTHKIKKNKSNMFLSVAIDMVAGMEHDFGSYWEKENKFKSLFGVSPEVAGTMWDSYLMENGLLLRHPLAKKKHLLWALLFLFSYPTETVSCVITKASRKTYRKWCWIMITELSIILKDLVSSKT